ncbi:MAG: M15 family metallopeptidase [Erysipelotrichales bacterium]|nr:M15 family metallopeptidase [Erysipelotrichales bacterium]
MKLKTWQLFVFVTVLFVGSFYVINLKFDKFYRVNGINNDNRVLIEKYLSEDEQTYLIDNQIDIDLFIHYIEYDEFSLVNYQYYDALKHTNRYKTKDILNIGNSLASRISYTYPTKAFDYAKQLIDLSLEKAFLNTDQFHFEYISLYTSMRPLYEKDDYSFIEDTHTYILKLNALGVTDKESIQNTFTQMTTAYNQSSLKELMSHDLSTNVQIIFNPFELTTVVNEKKYIGYYEPSSLLLTQDIPRARYAMYLQSDAYNALIKMYRDLSKEVNGFVLKGAYTSPQHLSNEKIGHEEFQLGLSIDITKSEVSYKDFDTTDLSQWLQQHAHEYGFILRYPQNKASVTNKAYDPHIYRYVGKSLAKSLFDSNLTLEEYENIEE